MFANMYEYVYMLSCVCTYLRVAVYMRTLVQECVYVDVCMRAHIVCVRTLCACVQMYMLMCVCVWVCMRAFVRVQVCCACA